MSEAIICNSNEKYNIIGYLEDGNNWAPKNINVSMLTHINYAFAEISEGILIGNHLKKINYLKQLKLLNPKLKILICIGGLGARSFSDVALTEESRTIFVDSAVKFVVDNDFNGIDIDWEYPCSSVCGFVSRPEDKLNFTLILKKLREELDVQGKLHNRHYLLTIAAGAGQEFVDNTEMNIIHHYLDFINLMTYDYHNSFESKTGHHTNLFQSTSDSDRCNTDNYVDILLNAGVPANKINIGAAFYGRGWTNVTNINNGLYQSAECNKEYAYCYYELVENYINKDGFKRYWDDSAKAPYLFNGDTFITYDDEESVYYKANYIKSKGLAGMMFWEYTQDTGSLLDKLYNELGV